METKKDYVSLCLRVEQLLTSIANTEDEWKQHFFIWLLERRQKEINKVKENLDSYDFPKEHEYYKSMIVDMITPPSRAIQTCMSKFIDYEKNNL